jgi:hypothetical protein
MMSFFPTSESTPITSISSFSLSLFPTTDGEWRAAEGLGLTYGFSRQFTDNVGSGRAESYAAYLFRPAKVEVFGTLFRG